MNAHNQYLFSLATEVWTGHKSAVCEVESCFCFYNYKRKHSVLDYMTPYQKDCELKNMA